MVSYKTAFIVITVSIVLILYRQKNTLQFVLVIKQNILQHIES